MQLAASRATASMLLAPLVAELNDTKSTATAAKPAAVAPANRGRVRETTSYSMKIITRSLWLLALVACAMTARADLQLTFQVIQKTEKPARDPGKEGPTHSSSESTLTVTLGDDYFTSVSEEETSAYDFIGKKIYRLDNVAKSYHVKSLYADIAFRDAELRNRMMLQKVLGAGQIKENPFDTVLMEHLFALKTPESTALVSREATGALAYTHGDKPLFSCSPGGRKITAAESRQFVRFLRYQLPAHPDILTELEKRNVVPEKLEVHHYNMQSDHFTFVLVKSSTVPRTFDASALVDGFKKNESDVQPVCALADAMSQDQFKAKCDELVRAAVAEGQAKRHLECIVLFLEYVLSSGQPLPQEFQTFRADLQADPTVKAFFSALSPKDKESAQKAADLMKTLRAGATKGHAVLRIHEANNLTAAGKPREALALFREALTESPWIVGAWKDFGDLYYGTYEMGTTWQCWDTGRRLHPTQRQFDPVRQFERKLATDHPEFF